MGKYFGTDGIRGVANRDLTPDLAMCSARRFGELLTRETPLPRIVVGRDTRISSPMLECAVAAGLSSAGVRPLLLGVLPTPCVPYFCKEFSAQGGIMISASHNPIEDNGIKFFNAQGFKIFDSMENEIEKMVDSPLDNYTLPISEEVGRVFYVEEAEDLFLNHLTSLIPVSLKGLRIGLDCANGAAFRLAPRVFQKLGAQIFPLHTESDGMKINVDCGSTNPRDLINLVLEKKLHLGLAFDGDADRCIAVDEQGGIFDGDKILAAFAWFMRDNGELQGNGVAATVMSNYGLELALRKLGLHLYRADVGDRNVLEKLIAEGCNLGGEQSGHIILFSHSTTGDGILTGIYLARILAEKEIPLSQIAKMVQPLPQILENIEVISKDKFLKDDLIQNEINRVEENLADKGRVLVRPSGTQPLIRIMLEGESREQLVETMNHLKGFIEKRLVEVGAK